MPNFCKFTKIGEAGYAKETDMDIEICNHFGIEPDDRYWVYDWHTSIAGRIAVGGDYDSVEADFRRAIEEHGNPTVTQFYNGLLAVLDYLRENYIHSSWASR